VVVTPAERARLVRLGRPLGRAVEGLVSIVSPRTFSRWLGASAQATRPSAISRRQPGRPPIGKALSELIRRMARETDWGYTRIHHELRRLGCGEVSRSTVANIVRAERGPGGSPDSGGSWDLFIRSHAESLWACDFISRKVLTPRDLVEHFVLFFIHVASRRVVVSPATPRPDTAWMAEQARAFAAVVVAESVRSETGSDSAAEGLPHANAAGGATPHSRVTVQSETKAKPPPLRLLRDNDRKFSRDFDEMLRSRPVLVAPRRRSTMVSSSACRSSACHAFGGYRSAHFAALIGNRRSALPPPPSHTHWASALDHGYRSASRTIRARPGLRSTPAA